MRSELRTEEVVPLCRDQGMQRGLHGNQWASHRRAVDPLRILVIDADVGRSNRIIAQVRTIGAFETRAASVIESALQLACDFLPNIVLLNTDLPHLAGYQLATALRWRAGLAGMRLIALTSDLPAVDRRRALEAGFEQCLTIPLQHATLETVLRRGLPQDVHSQRVARRPH